MDACGMLAGTAEDNFYDRLFNYIQILDGMRLRYNVCELQFMYLFINFMCLFIYLFMYWCIYLFINLFIDVFIYICLIYAF